MSEMDDANRRDSQTERVCRDAVRALDAVLSDDNRLPESVRARTLGLREIFKDAADHIVAVWD